MKNIIVSSLEKSKSYPDYRTFVSEALQNNPQKLEIEDTMLPYATLNETRLKRLDKTTQIGEQSALKIQELKKSYIWLVITESWCGDAAQCLPILNKLAELSDLIDMRLVFRDQNLELMDLFLTNGGRAIPKLLVLDPETKEVLNHWGPRPAGAVAYVENYKATHGALDEAGKEGLFKWYNENKGEQIEEEVVAMMLDLDK
ncbi:thioredoxin family protein [Myroides guanonis]|uniref:Thioredoxin n=1 Tax=Myroides guanonis TaxID=1150112 RepID=A0A1I3Q8G6_9FLAO|nr:thioredoxin family protein [Myroides guanonis]SFJ30544.1 Thioredoxin [Myroides guanonis]